MSYLSNSIYLSGSLTGSQRSPKLVVIESQIISASLNANYIIFTGSNDIGNFIPHKVNFFYSSVGTNASTPCQYHLGYTSPNYNDFVSSASLNGVSNNVMSTVQPTLLSSASMPANSNLVIRISRAGTNIPTGSFVIYGTAWDF